jgi:hypothetical protein
VLRPFLLLLGVLGIAGQACAQTHLVAEFKGNTSTSTTTFTVGDKWEVAWDTPMPLRITLLTADGTIVAGTAGMFRGSFYQPKGGTFYLQVNGPANGAMAPWHLSVVEVGAATAGAAPTANGGGLASNGGPDTNFLPPSVLPPSGTTPPTLPPGTASGTPAAGAVVAPSAAAAAAPAAPVINLTEDQTRAVVMIEGDNAEGTGFLVKMPEGPCVVTNIHVLANNPNIRVLTNTGAQITTLGLKGASDRDLAIFSIKDLGYSYLNLNTDITGTVQTGDDVITPGNSQGGEVVLDTHGTVLGVGPQRIEFSNHIYHTTNDLDKASFASRSSAITGSMRYFGLRIDTVPQWETYDLPRFQNETAFLDQFHEQSRRLDSYLNSSDKTDSQATSQGDPSAPPDSKLYLTDSNIVKAHSDFMQQANGADAAQRLDAFRGWLFALQGVVDKDLEAIQNPNNFYLFDRQRAHEETLYRKALKTELDSFGDDISRAESLGHRNN